MSKECKEKLLIISVQCCCKIVEIYVGIKMLPFILNTLNKLH